VLLVAWKTEAVQRSGERIEGPTPAGGVAFIGYFYGPEGESLPTDAGAVEVEIHELDADGNVIQRTYGVLG
jgi:hypothetical protein